MTEKYEIPFPEIIRHKRDGHASTPDEIRAFVAGVSDGSIPDYQVAAMLMAIFLVGMNDDETAILADAMTRSGDIFDLSRIDRPKADKHSTGGVGDKISLPLAPAVAACGVAVPMCSGRGLGHSGGTLDKLESIPGFGVNLSPEAFIDQVDRIGVAMIGQTERLAPADRRLYALRDVTATVESIPLIASSIMSKKLAEGIDALVLDCKVGHGAFMKTMDRARALSQAISAIGRAAAKAVTVMITNMDEPIGRYVGNAFEVRESIEVLRGQGPADTRELTVHLGGEMLHLTGQATSPEHGCERIARVLDNGRALEVFGRLIEAQGGDPSVIDHPERLPTAPDRAVLCAARAGYITDVLAADIGHAAVALGAGRARKDDIIDPAVAIEMAVQVGDKVDTGQDLAYFWHRDERGLGRAQSLCQRAIVIGDTQPTTRASRILEVIR